MKRPEKKPLAPEQLEELRIEAERVRLGRRLDEIRNECCDGDLRGPDPDHPAYAEYQDLLKQARRLPKPGLSRLIDDRRRK